MIISRVPFRMSFVGGGTDLKAFYEHQYGAVLSTAINKYIYITIKKQSELFPDRYRISYSKTENVNSVNEIEHPIIKEAFKMLEIDEPLEVSVIADIPAKTGLGSSSSFTVGLLHALHVVKGEFVSPEQLAEEAIEIEVVRLARPMGKQDHYAAAFGGMNEIRFMPDESTIVSPVVCHKDMREKFFGHLMAFYTFQTRDSHSILKEQTENTVNKMDVLKEMRDMVTPFRKVLEESGSVEGLGRVLDIAWQRKKTLQGKISNSQIDTLYEAAKGAGAIGGKLLGAGGGGFLLMVVPPEKRESVESVMYGAMELDFTYEPQGSTIIYYKED